MGNISSIEQDISNIERGLYNPLKQNLLHDGILCPSDDNRNNFTICPTLIRPILDEALEKIVGLAIVVAVIVLIIVILVRHI
jgi:hypothetical protein